MAIVNFSIPNVLEKRVNATIKRKGFASKAEFFRFAAVHFIDGLDKPVVDKEEEERFRVLTDTLKREVSRLYGGKTLPSAREQLADV